jgi:hypothetical protein
MRLALTLPIVLGLTTLTAFAGAYDSSIAINDIAGLSDESIDALKDAEFAVLKAQVELARAQGQNNGLKAELKDANRKLDAKSLDLKAAKSEVKAAQANVGLKNVGTAAVNDPNNPYPESPERLSKANARLETAQYESDTARSLVAWKEAEIDRVDTLIAAREQAAEVASIKRDRARVEAMQKEQVAAHSKYSEAELSKRLESVQQRFDKAEVKRSEAKIKADQAKNAYESRRK